MNEERIEIFFETFMESPKLHIMELEKKAKREGVPIIRRPARNLLRYLMRTKEPVNILEIGTAVGYSALFMKEYLPSGGQITTIEKVPARIKEAELNFQKYDPEQKIHLLKGDARDILRQLVLEEKTFDFIFMDAAKGQYLNFLTDVLALLEIGGILISDNILHEGDIIESRYAVTRRDRTIHSRMREYLRVITHNSQLETICLSLGDGMTISTKTAK